MSLFLLTLLTACGTEKRVVITPPPILLEDCRETPFDLRVNGDMPLAIRSLKTDLKLCNADKTALRAWYKDMAD